MSYILSEEWKNALAGSVDEEFKRKLFSFVNAEYAQHTVFPPKDKVFRCLNFVPMRDIKVVIIGQDPYHTEGQADGLAFSCAMGRQQPSLANIFKEIHNELGIEMSADSSDLTHWAEQGVVLLNTSLTVRKGEPASHSKIGWYTITSKIVEIINNLDQPIVFMLWGSHAKAFAPLLDNPHHLVLTCAHPSPFSAYSGFFGCGHFSKANDFLVEHGVEPIDWQI